MDPQAVAAAIFMAALQNSPEFEVSMHIINVAYDFENDEMLTLLVEQILVDGYSQSIIEQFVARVHTRIGVVMGKGKDDSRALEESLHLVRSVYFKCLVEHVKRGMLENKPLCTLKINSMFAER